MSTVASAAVGASASSSSSGAAGAPRKRRRVQSQSQRRPRDDDDDDEVELGEEDSEDDDENEGGGEDESEDEGEGEGEDDEDEDEDEDEEEEPPNSTMDVPFVSAEDEEEEEEVPDAPPVMPVAAGEAEGPAEGDEDPENLESGAKQRATLRHENYTLKRKLEEESEQHSRCKLALGACVKALREADIELPTAVGAAQPTGTTSVVEGNDDATSPAPVPAPIVAALPAAVVAGGFNFTLMQEGTLSLTGVTEPTRATSEQWPHAIGTYKREKAALVSLAEQARKHYITLRLTRITPVQSTGGARPIRPTEKLMLTQWSSHTNTAPACNFRISLVYADNHRRVTVSSLLAKHRTKLDGKPVAEPVELFEGKSVPMANGKVKFTVDKLLITSHMTQPMHRKFKFKVECVHPELSKHKSLTFFTEPFYSVSKAHVPSQSKSATTRRARHAATPATAQDAA